MHRNINKAIGNEHPVAERINLEKPLVKKQTGKKLHNSQVKILKKSFKRN